MKLLTPSSNYPESYWLSYDHANSVDHVMFYKCEKLAVAESKPKMTLKKKVSLAAIRQYDYLFSDGPDLVSAKLAKVISSSEFSSDVQLVGADVTINGETYSDYSIINYLKSESAFDMVASVYRPLIKSMPDGPKKFSKIVLLNKKPDNGIFRSLESNSHVIVCDDAAQCFKINSIKGVEFWSGKDGL